MSLLKALMDKERAERAAEKARSDAINQEFHDAVAALHAAWKPYEAEVGDLTMRVRAKLAWKQRDAQQSWRESHKAEADYTVPDGLVVSVKCWYPYGDEKSPYPPKQTLLRVIVAPRLENKPLTITINRGESFYATGCIGDNYCWSVANIAVVAPQVIERLLGFIAKEAE